jgi:hypothetical protein
MRVESLDQFLRYIHHYLVWLGSHASSSPLPASSDQFFLLLCVFQERLPPSDTLIYCSHAEMLSPLSMMAF